MIDFYCKQKDLKEAVAKVIKAVPSKAQMPALECIKLDVTFSGTVDFTGFDLTTGIKVVIEADVKECDSILVNGKLLNSIVKKLPKGTIHIYSDEHLKLSIETGDTRFDLLALSADLYPAMESVHSAVQTFMLPQATLSSMLAQTLYAKSSSDAKPILKGGHFELSDNVLNIVALDGFRCAIRREGVPSEYDLDLDFTVNGEALEKIAGLLCTDADAEAKITFRNKQVSFELRKGADCTLITRLLLGEFFQWRKIAPAKVSTLARVNVSDLRETLERAHVISADSLPCAELNFTQNGLKVSINSTKGCFEESLSISSEGEPVRVGFNINYLLDALRAVPDAEVQLKLAGALSPMTITPIEGDAYMHVLLPVRLKN